MTVKVSELCRIVTSGGTPSRKNSKYFDPGTIPWVKTMDLKDGPVHRYDEYISEKGLYASAAKMLPAGTVLMAMYGATVGRLGWLVEPAACNQAAFAMVADEGVCDGRWLFYALMWARSELVGLASGAAQQNLNGGLIKDLKLPTFTFRDQQATAEVLRALDEKVFTNATVVEKADQLRRARVAVAAASGEERPLSTLARFVNGRAFTKNATGTGRVVVRIAELNSGLGPSTVYNEVEVADHHEARPGDLLFAWSGSLTIARWYRDEAIVNQHIFKVLPDANHPMWLVDYALRTKLSEFQSVAADKATTMGHIQRRHLDEPVRIPEVHDVQRLDAPMSALWKRALAAELESVRLEEVRNEILPLLMTGAITVKDAHKVAEEVL